MFELLTNAVLKVMSGIITFPVHCPLAFAIKSVKIERINNFVFIIFVLCFNIKRSQKL